MSVVIPWGHRSWCAVGRKANVDGHHVYLSEIKYETRHLYALCHTEYMMRFLHAYISIYLWGWNKELDNDKSKNRGHIDPAHHAMKFNGVHGSAQDKTMWKTVRQNMSRNKYSGWKKKTVK